MNREEKKAKIQAYLNTKPDMGIIYLRCLSTNEYFIAPSLDTRANLNRNVAQLKFQSHQNKRLQGLWEKYGEKGFEWGILEALEYDEKQPDKRDYREEIEALCLKWHGQLALSENIR